MKKKSCICNDTSLVTSKRCVRCTTVIDNISLDDLERGIKCPEHKKKVVCGLRDFVCVLCREAGWYSTAGWGGLRELFNDKTKERIPY